MSERIVQFEGRIAADRFLRDVPPMLPPRHSSLRKHTASGTRQKSQRENGHVQPPVMNYPPVPPPRPSLNDFPSSMRMSRRDKSERQEWGQQQTQHVTFGREENDAFMRPSTSMGFPSMRRREMEELQQFHEDNDVSSDPLPVVSTDRKDKRRKSIPRRIKSFFAFTVRSALDIINGTSNTEQSFVRSRSKKRRDDPANHSIRSAVTQRPSRFDSYYPSQTAGPSETRQSERSFARSYSERTVKKPRLPQQTQEHHATQTSSNGIAQVERPAMAERALTMPFLTGLPNVGNSCFLNSAIQGIVPTEIFQMLLHGEHLTPKMTKMKGSQQAVEEPMLCYCLQKLFRKLYLNENADFEYRELLGVTMEILPVHVNGVQQDVGELITCMLQRIHEETQPADFVDRNPQTHDTRQLAWNHERYRDKRSPYNEAALILTEKHTFCNAKCKFEQFEMDRGAMMMLNVFEEETLKKNFIIVSMPRVKSVGQNTRFVTRIESTKSANEVMSMIELLPQVNGRNNSQLFVRYDDNGFLPGHIQNAFSVLPFEDGHYMNIAVFSLVPAEDRQANIVNVLFTVGDQRTLCRFGPFHITARTTDTTEVLRWHIVNTLNSYGKQFITLYQSLELLRLTVVAEDKLMGRYAEDERMISTNQNWKKNSIVEEAININKQRYSDKPKFVRLHAMLPPNYLIAAAEPYVEDDSVNQARKIKDSLDRIESGFLDFGRAETMTINCPLNVSHGRLSHKYRIAKLPNTLFVQLKRFVRVSDVAHTKINQKLSIPLSLNLERFMSEGRPAEIHSPYYTLVSIICHLGATMENGHYITLMRNPVDGIWRSYNDDLVGVKQSWQEDLFANEVSYVCVYEKSENVENRMKNSRLDELNLGQPRPTKVSEFGGFTLNSGTRNVYTSEVPHPVYRRSLSAGRPRREAINQNGYSREHKYI